MFDDIPLAAFTDQLFETPHYINAANTHMLPVDTLIWPVFTYLDGGVLAYIDYEPAAIRVDTVVEFSRTFVVPEMLLVEKSQPDFKFRERLAEFTGRESTKTSVILIELPTAKIVGEKIYLGYIVETDDIVSR